MPNHAAYTRADAADAKRGYPEVDLSAYATARGLAPEGQALVGHFGGLNPLWPHYVFNVMRGELVAGRFGTVQHELDEVSLDDDGDPRQSGTYYSRRSNSKPGLRGLIGLEKEIPNEPFATQAMWLPTTGIKLLVPEAAVLPRMVLQTKEHMSWSDKALAAAPSFGMRKSDFVAPELRDGVGAMVGPILQGLGVTFARLELSHGALGLRVDGFRREPADLDRLVAATSAMADAFAKIAELWWAPAAFDLPLGDFDLNAHPPGFRTFQTDWDQTGHQQLQQVATALGMSIEDPVALHRRIPRLPIPGTSMGVLAGNLPGSKRFARLTWQTQAHPGSSSYLRPAAIVATTADVAPTPIGGTLLPSTDMYAAVGDGLACCWTRHNTIGRLEADDLVARALATFSELGV
ncbi:MAG: hypothetical protein K8R99_00990 [Actinomycetia bacterium]|nr:hypothetical protein [Actinomycetes bacterium]